MIIISISFNEKIIITMFLLHSYAQNNLTALKMRRKLYICLIESTRYTFMLSERELYIYVRGISCSSFRKNCSNKKSVLGKVNRRTGSYGY